MRSIPFLAESVGSFSGWLALGVSFAVVVACSPAAQSESKPVIPAPVASSSSPVAVAPAVSVNVSVPVNMDEPMVMTAAPAQGGPAGFKPSEKVDLLFVVDNSLSMGDKQAVFADAVPDLIRYLAHPPCVDATQAFVEPSAAGNCPLGSKAVFKPVNDIHIGVLSSSLGTRGTVGPEIPFGCQDVPEQNDKGWLMGVVRNELRAETYQGSGFLVWDPEQKANPPGEGNLDNLVATFTKQIKAVGERGCGFEAPLEAAYRFLSEPDPYESVQRVKCANQPATDTQLLCAEKVGTDTSLLAQRKQFLRDDSVVVVMYLTDENDCSVKTQGQGFLALSPTPLANGTVACDTNPDDPCCYSCNGSPPMGCTVPVDQNGCKTATVAHDATDALNVRCFNQKARFGADFLRRTDFYAAGFMKEQLADRNNMAQDNPLLSAVRGPEKVFVVGVVGVPWQDTATPETKDHPNNLDLIRTEKLQWENFLPANGMPAADPFNRESVTQRSGTSPISNASIGGPGTWNVVNGHDRPLKTGDGIGDDLQYSCTFELPTPRDCTTVPDDAYCDCRKGTDKTSGLPLDTATNNPLCMAPPAAGGAPTGMYGTTQYFAKAYPSPRVIEVLKGVGRQGLLASICPRQVKDRNKPDFGYRPVIRALLLNASTALIQ